MKKIIKKWGPSLVIRFSPDDMEMYGIKEGDIIEIDDDVLRRAGEQK
jgi:antitoxin component of MazEF toxin-antitoxin module